MILPGVLVSWCDIGGSLQHLEITFYLCNVSTTSMATFSYWMGYNDVSCFEFYDSQPAAYSANEEIIGT